MVTFNFSKTSSVQDYLETSQIPLEILGSQGADGALISKVGDVLTLWSKKETTPVAGE
jgi:hypothetical protein